MTPPSSSPSQKRVVVAAAAAALFLAFAPAAVVANVKPSSGSFVTRSGSRILDEDGAQIRFTSFNIPNLHYLEDRDWPRKFPTPFEQQDALRSIAQIGGQVTRSYVISVAAKGDTGAYSHIAAGTADQPPANAAPLGWVAIPQISKSDVQLYANEELFVALDNAFAVAGSLGLRVILPFVDRWSWWGGVPEFAGLYGGAFDDFFYKQEIVDGFLSVVQFILNRRNTINGLLYKEDGAVFAWETGNELTTSDFKPVPGNWTTTVAKFIKDTDKNHLVIDGQYGLYGWDAASVASPYIDIFSNHYYDNGESYIDRAVRDTQFFSSHSKAFIIGEFGLASFDKLSGLVAAFEDLVDATGCMIWSLRYHARDGGFYVHSEGFPYSAYHWPGFPKTDDGNFAKDEADVVYMMHRSALRLSKHDRFQSEPPTPAPTLLPAVAVTGNATVAQLRWTGSTGAKHYVVERAVASESGPWTEVTDTVQDNKKWGQVLFEDALPAGTKKAWYRVYGENKFGTTYKSNVVALEL
ncbi:glycoside hydrolase superfamily [Zopfochytrium polystomum]|nr:glycoside hydrolase superfamily [Zopfochytrium polystomum]